MAPLIASVLGICTIQDISFCLSLHVSWRIAKPNLIVLSAHVSHFAKSGESLCLGSLPCGPSPIPSCPPCFRTGHLSTPPPHDQGVTGGGCADDQRPKALRFTSRRQREVLKQLLRHLPPKYFGLIQFALGLPSASTRGQGGDSEAIVHTPTLAKGMASGHCLDSAWAYAILMKEDFSGIARAYSSRTKGEKPLGRFWGEGTTWVE